MFNRILATLLLLTTLHLASADDRPKTWYEKGYEGPEIITLSDAIRAEKAFLGPNNRAWSMRGDTKVCAALEAVKLPCDYNTRCVLSHFLTLNGKGLFPASGRTNPYFSEHRPDDGFPDDYFIGQSAQNAMLAAAIRRNAKLFVNGDITAKSVRENWR